jgi:hypothetical protein
MRRWMGASVLKYYNHYNTYDFCSAAEPLKVNLKYDGGERVVHRASYKKQKIVD